MSTKNSSSVVSRQTSWSSLASWTGLASWKNLASWKSLAVVLPATAALFAGFLTLGGTESPAGPGAQAVKTATSGMTATGMIAPDDGSARLIKIASSSSATFSPEQKSAIETIVKDYLIANPELMLEIQAALQAKSEKLESDRLKVAIKTNAAELYSRPNAAIAGNPNGDVTLVEFFDYNCGFCKRALGDIAKLVESDDKLRVVFKELPILSKGSEEAARVALAARLQGKYWEMHKALLSARGRASEKSALKLAARLGLDMDKLKRDTQSAGVSKEIDDTRTLAQAMGINGTPHFLIGDKVIPGAPTTLLQEVKGHIADIRKNGCSVC